MIDEKKAEIAEEKAKRKEGDHERSPLKICGTVGKEKEFLLHENEDKFLEMKIFCNLVFFILTFVFSNQFSILKNFE